MNDWCSPSCLLQMKELNMDEVWRDTLGHEGCYQVSDLGRVRSLDHEVTGGCHHTGKSFTRVCKGKILRPGRYCKSGHLSIPLGRRTGGSGIPVHQLVMLAFVGEPPEGMEVCHINGDPTDNRLVNLRYDTRTQNILDVYRQGRPWRKLNLDDVSYIRFALFCGIQGVELARQFDVSHSCISAIKTGRTYSWAR